MLDTFKDNIDTVKDGFIKKHPRLTAFFNIIQKTSRNFNKDEVGIYAAQSAFFSVLSSVPFLMLIILCLKYFINVNLEKIIEPVRNAFPEVVSSYISRIIIEVFYRSESIVLLSATVITTLWTSSRGTMAVYSGFNRIFGYVKRRNWLVSRIASFFYNILFLAVIVAAVVILVFGNALLNFFNDEFMVAHYIIVILFKLKSVIFFVVFVLWFAVMYTYLPQRKTKYKTQIPGAVFTSFGWLAFSHLFSIYIMYFSKYSFLYGSLAAIVLLMLWVYFCVYMLLIGAEINKNIENGYLGALIRRIKRIMN